ncbi:MAG: hypothetical protein MZV70_76145 [Desulfobacterales bacterium]|nr:hypothetical protein [Desulfobacterales bacterium]
MEAGHLHAALSSARAMQAELVSASAPVRISSPVAMISAIMVGWVFGYLGV